jgi:RNA polymerase sigma-70 factor (ECF subfamily)
VNDSRKTSGGETSPANPSLTSLSLLEAVRARDPEAWQRLAPLYGPLVYGWCRRQGLQAGDAEDVVQDVFLTVAARVADFRREREGDTFRGWLWTVMRHKIGDWIRRRNKQPQAAGGTDAYQHLQTTPAPDAGEADGDSGAASLYRRGLDLIRAEFEERTWQAFWRVAGQDPADVAAALGLSRNAVYVAKSRVLRRLREVLGED